MANVNDPQKNNPAVEYIAMFDNGGRRGMDGRVRYPAEAGCPVNEHEVGTDVFDCDHDY